MPTRRIDEKDDQWKLAEKPCRHPEHNPPSHRVFPPGLYEHECPGCGRKFQFRVAGPVWSVRRSHAPSLTCANLPGLGRGVA